MGFSVIVDFWISFFFLVQLSNNAPFENFEGLGRRSVVNRRLSEAGNNTLSQAHKYSSTSLGACRRGRFVSLARARTLKGCLKGSCRTNRPTTK